jgi:hypothetical protein
VNDTADIDIASAASAAKKQIEERAERESEQRKMDERVDAIKAQNKAEEARAAEEKKRKEKADADLDAKEAEATRKAKAEERIRANAEAVKNRQEAQESLAAMKRDAAAKQAANKAREREEEILRSQKATSAQRIAARNRIDEMNRKENKRIEEANAKLTGQQPSYRKPDMKKITPGTIKEAIGSAAGRAPANLSTFTTNVFGGVSESLIKQPTGKGAQKMFKQESQLLSRAIKPHAKTPITGGRVTPVLKGSQVTVAPNYVDSLLGRGQDRVRTHPKKGGSLLGSLDNFVKRI